MDGFMEGPYSDPDVWVVGLVRETLDINSIQSPTRQDVARILFEAWDFIEETFQEFNSKYADTGIALKPIDFYVDKACAEIENSALKP